ncbi:outer membrane protein TolC [Salibacterium salarium]|uniref:TolC family protein n=1 Tax=Salibacterium salarium TaxID=284579 RepID=UPI00278061AA|nr:TolC family protein [Salibacterium salarium]MDQ0297923.1 outer membrane protein TolC [Salibacterium salarium]
MKKSIVAGLSAVLVAANIVPSALADEDNDSSADEQQAEENEEELVQTLTMEEAVDHALNDDTSLLLLNYQLENMKSQLNGLEDDHEDLNDDLDDLEDQMDNLRDVQRETGERTFQSRLELQNQMETLEDNLDELEDSIQELDTNTTTSEIDKQATKESMELSAISTFTQLVMAKDQLDLLHASLETEEQTVANTQKRHDLGLVSRDELDTAKREVTRLESEISQSKLELERDMAEFALDIGITYHSDLSLEEPEIGELEPLQQETETEELIENSYSMKSAKKELELAEYNQEQVYEDEDATSHEEEQADIDVQIAEEEIVQLRENLTTSIESLFTEADTQYQNVISTEDELNYAKTDYANLKTQVDIGVAPESEYELSQLQVTEAELNHKVAEQNYFLLCKQIESLRSGLVEQQQSQQ